MKKSALLALAISLCLSGVFTSLALADQGLIREVEGLRVSLPAQDPTRPTLTLRLADLYFDEIGNISRGHDLTPADQAQVSQLQLRAVAAYQEALTGSSGLFKSLTGTLALKVQFQLARLYADMGRADLSNPLWGVLAKQDLLPDLKREASLRLAEIAENEHDYPRSEAMYKQAITLCNGMDVCSYAHYRRAWMMKNQGKLNDAVSEIELALWDSKGQVREEALRDYITFLGERASDGKIETTQVEALMGKINRPSLLSDLSASFFAAGNRPGGVYTLALVDSRAPTIKNKVRLLEEYYGLKQWDAFHRTLDEVRAMPVPSNFGTDVETEKVLKRLTVQFDGERVSQPQYTQDFKSTVGLHLALFPHHEDTVKMMEGWLAAEANDDLKAQALQGWLTNPAFQLSQAAQIELHESRAAVAQKKKDDVVVATEMKILSQLVSDTAKKREYRYVYARSLYGMKQNAESLPVFLELADISASKPDQWAIQSQNLALDVYAQQKDYDSIAHQAVVWTSSPLLQAAAQKDPALHQELIEMSAIAEKAQFEKASAAGNSANALKIFSDFCTSGKLLPGSCDNAKILAVHLKDETALLTILKTQKSDKELASEYEASGYFVESAALLEKQLSSSSWKEVGYKDVLKVALLYELGHKNGDRDRVLSALLRSARGWKSFGELEDLFFTTLKDSALLSPNLLAMNWTERNRARLAEALEANQQTSRKTDEILLGTLTSTGPKWNTLVLQELGKLNAQQSKIQFYGARSQKKFAARLEALKKTVSFSEKYLPGSDTETRAQMLDLLQKSHQELADLILKTPIPEAVQGDQIKQVQDALGKMAEPFQEKAKAYAELLQKNGVPVAQAVRGQDQLGISQSAPQGSSQPSNFQTSEDALHKNPSDVTALTDLRDYYQSTKQDRLAAYFKGRLLHEPNAK